MDLFPFCLILLFRLQKEERCDKYQCGGKVANSANDQADGDIKHIVQKGEDPVQHDKAQEDHAKGPENVYFPVDAAFGPVWPATAQKDQYQQQVNAHSYQDAYGRI